MRRPRPPNNSKASPAPPDLPDPPAPKDPQALVDLADALAFAAGRKFDGPPEQLIVQALKIDPRHQGALEYAGELALMKRDLPTAEAHLAALAKLCTSPCEPLDDLRKAVAAYKAANK